MVARPCEFESHPAHIFSIYEKITRSSWLRVKRSNGGRPNSQSEFNAISAFRRSAGGEIGIHATLRG